MVGKLPGTANICADEIIVRFYQGLSLFDAFDGERFFDCELGESLKKENCDFLAVYDPADNKVMSFCFSEFFDHWLDAYLPNPAAKQHFGQIVLLKMDQIFNGINHENVIFERFIIGH